MKNKFYVLIAFVGLMQMLACKKDAQPAKTPVQVQSLENGLLTFSINGELIAAEIDTTANTILVTIPDWVNEQNLTASLTLASQVGATINNTTINGTFVYDFSKPVNLTVLSADKKRSITFKVSVQTELQYFGLENTVIAAKSLNKGYNFYFDQFDGSVFQSINCGPTVSTMAITWADATFSQTPAYARTQREPQGGWWLTTDVQAYLYDNHISATTDTLSNIDSLVKKSIDNNNLVILCLDMSYVPLNQTAYQHINKFYDASTIGWGHFLLVKGYKQLAYNSFYLEIYDPYSERETYSGLDNGQIKGKDRYYLSADIKIATDNWWPYAIIVAPKGRKVTASSHLTVNSIGKPKTIPVARGR